MKVQIFPVGEGNNDNIHFNIKIGSKKNPFIRIKLVGFFSTMDAYITHCSIPEEQLEYFNLSKISSDINEALKKFDFELKFLNYHRDFLDNKRLKTDDITRMTGNQTKNSKFNLVKYRNKEHYYLISTKSFSIGTELTNFVTGDKEKIVRYTDDKSMFITEYESEIGKGENWIDINLGYYKEQIYATTDPELWREGIKKINEKSIKNLNINDNVVVYHDVLFKEKITWDRNIDRNIPTKDDIDKTIIILAQRNDILIKN